MNPLLCDDCFLRKAIIVLTLLGFVWVIIDVVGEIHLIDWIKKIFSIKKINNYWVKIGKFK